MRMGPTKRRVQSHGCAGRICSANSVEYSVASKESSAVNHGSHASGSRPAKFSLTSPYSVIHLTLYITPCGVRELAPAFLLRQSFRRLLVQSSHNRAL